MAIRSIECKSQMAQLNLGEKAKFPLGVREGREVRVIATKGEITAQAPKGYTMFTPASLQYLARRIK